MKRKLPGRGRDVHEKANWAEAYESRALLSYSAFILTEHSRSWLLSQRQGMLPRRWPRACKAALSAGSVQQEGPPGRVPWSC